MPHRNKRYEADAAAEYLKNIKAWAVNSRPDLDFIFARGHNLRLAASLLKFT